MSLPTSFRAVLVAAAAVGASQPLLAQRAPVHQIGHGVVLQPNRVKYSDAGARPVRGRSGSASIEARALVSKDGTTLLEATTGSFDAGTAPGFINKVQVKLLSADGKTESVQNFPGRSGSGYWSTSLQGVGRDQQIQLQANVGGIDGHRTDVVTVTARTERRPDIALDALTAPAKALSGSRLNVVAVVAEKNGDVGARTTCMLSVDGNLVDQASGIWVDAGQSVSCAFQTSVEAIGTHQVGVYTTGVSPTDWDPSNNAATTPIEIVAAESPLSYSATFKSQDYDYRTHDKRSSDDGTFVNENTVSGTQQNRTLSLTSWTGTQSFAFPVRVRSALSTAGSAVFDLTNDIAASPYDANCGDLLLGRVYVSVCNTSIGGAARSEIVLSSFDARVTYFGRQFYQTDGTDGYYVDTNRDVTSGAGAYAVGADVRPVVELTDNGGVKFVSRPVITLQSSPINVQWNSCVRSPYNGLTTCSDGLNQGTSMTGSANESSH